jgi:hypothetical protein
VSDEKPKPFARVLVLGGETFTVGYGSGPHLLHGLPMSELESVARASDLNAEFNTAVEQREAKLRGAHAAIADLHEVHWLRVADADVERRGGDGNPDNVYRRDEHQHRVMASVARDIAKEIRSLGPNPPEYVPIEQLRAEQAKVKALQAALDVLDTREGMTAEMVRTYLEGNGLKKPNNIVNRAAAAALLLEASNLEKRISYVSSEFGGAMRALAGELRARAKAYEATSDSTTERRPWDPLYSVGVATADLAEGQMVEVDVTNRTVSPVIVHLQRVAESHLSLCPHGHGGEMTIDVTRVTCSDCRALAAGRETPPPAP